MTEGQTRCRVRGVLSFIPDGESIPPEATDRLQR